ncbi:unnamed protein product [Sympodiomycopsis kandeliae]
MFSHSFSQLLTVLVAATLVSAAPKHGHKKGYKSKPSVIQLIGDGFGPASETFARSFVQARDNLPWDAELALDKHIVGTIRTRSTDSLVTDSAASATAYSCGVKSVNAYIGVDQAKKPCGTVLEGAKAKGYNTALVTTSRITHATPASYSAHIDDRNAENDIAAQQLGNYLLGRQADILWGGGLRHFLPNTSSGSSRKDSRDLVDEARQAGWTVALNRSTFDSWNQGENVQLPSLGLFTKSHLPYEIDRVASEQPSLSELAIAALNALKKADEPFFIMIEGARIDHAAHNQDPVGHLHDILEYNKMYAAVEQWVNKNFDHHDEDEDPQVLMISTADHECGGLTLAREREEDAAGAYLWYPDVLLKADRSTEFLSAAYLDWLKNNTNASADDKKSYMKNEIIIKHLAVADVQDDEVARAVELPDLDKSGLSLTIWLASIVNWRAHLNWSTTGHSGVDVNLYLHTPTQEGGKNSKKNKRLSNALISDFRGNHENTWIGSYVADYLKLDLASITKKLNNGSDYEAGSSTKNKTTVIDHYHGGLKRVVPATPRVSKSERRSLGLSHRENDEILARMREGTGLHERSHSEL